MLNKLSVLIVLFLLTSVFSSCILFEIFLEEVLLMEESFVMEEGMLARSSMRAGLRSASGALRARSIGSSAASLSRASLAGRLTRVRLIRNLSGRPKLAIRSVNGKIINKAELVSESQIRLLKSPYEIVDLKGKIYSFKRGGVWVRKYGNMSTDGNILYHASKDELLIVYREEGSWVYAGVVNGASIIEGYVLANELLKADTNNALPSVISVDNTYLKDDEFQKKINSQDWNLKYLSQFKEYKIVDEKQQGSTLIRIIDFYIDTWDEKNVFLVRTKIKYNLLNSSWHFSKVLEKTVIDVKSQWSNCSYCDGNGMERQYSNLLCQKCWGSGKISCYNCARKICGSCQGFGGEGCANCNSSGRLACVKCSQSGFIQYYNFKETCDNCRGKGFISCDNCRGRGKFICNNCKGEGKVPEYSNIKIDCSECSGSGRIEVRLVCNHCNGSGKIKTAF